MMHVLVECRRTPLEFQSGPDAVPRRSSGSDSKLHSNPDPVSPAAVLMQYRAGLEGVPANPFLVSIRSCACLDAVPCRSRGSVGKRGSNHDLVMQKPRCDAVQILRKFRDTLVQPQSSPALVFMRCRTGQYAMAP
ncbi:hypothetical protein QAD02_002006 [Eretmocerus hayati]|uniref:Uncharacterized protein n=1 Tax=Eretmocerus hayati TaxID=131215 RepID=A0ACC2NI18_9HYME|nr:hypothetical protein QAD02_002006 [Eretmocerus hayati]